ncbi:amidohydrolase family protein [Rhizoctonia solani]|uniref:Amidohydrolase family protein n=1 Tax=Rhizoctonia solani TaxID=456999 RepID=A0A8H8NY05_9AGAM|nr:amidohydrolase family protein [Rhizoctonia solani]QRW20973.1 amidohydrolase family protein [Rhizoctonia solani]
MTISLAHTLTDNDRAAIKTAAENLLPEAIQLLKDLTNIDTTNPPGLNYPRIASVLDDFLSSKGYDVERILVPPDLHPELAPFSDLPRVNVFAKLRPDSAIEDRGRVIHFKGGIVAQIFAIEALRKAGIPIREQSNKVDVDEETTGVRNAGMGYLVEQRYIARGKQDAVVITEPLNTTNVCLGHRGTIWGRIIFKGLASHGSTPQRGVNALLHASLVVAEAHRAITPQLKKLKDAHVVPPEAQEASLTFTVLQSGSNTNTVPAAAILEFDRRLVPGETLDKARREIMSVLDEVKKQVGEDFNAEYSELYSTNPVWVGDSKDSTTQELIGHVKNAIKNVLDVEAGVVCSPGSDDQRFVVRNAGIESCVVYGPGNIRNIHNKDESLSLEDLRTAIEVMAIFTAEFLNTHRYVVYRPIYQFRPRNSLE